MSNVSYWGIPEAQKTAITQSHLTTITEVAIIITCAVLIIWLIRHWK